MRRVPENRTAVGLTYFVTSRLQEHHDVFESQSACERVIGALQFYRQRGDIELYGFVVMPDHIHVIAKMRADITLEWWMNRFKSFVAHELGAGPIWQKGYWSEVIPNVSLLEQKLAYVHDNPVRAGLVGQAEEFLWSSAKDYAASDLSGRIDHFA
jgi:putative transposase